MSEFQELLQEQLKDPDFKKNGMTFSQKWMSSVL